MYVQVGTQSRHHVQHVKTSAMQHEWYVFPLFYSGLPSSNSDRSAHQVGWYRVSQMTSVFFSYWKHEKESVFFFFWTSSLQTPALLWNWWEDPAELHGCSFPGSERHSGQRSLLDALPSFKAQSEDKQQADKHFHNSTEQ